MKKSFLVKNVEPRDFPRERSTMLYKDIPYHKIYMYCQAVIETDYQLPNGYRLVSYPEGSEGDWCRIQLESGHVGSIEEAHAVFKKDFASDAILASTRMLFVLAPSGIAVGTVSLWKGKPGFPKHRLHWLGVCDDYAGKGIAKYLVQEACRIVKHDIYLDSQTWSYPAIHIYQSLGFVRWNPTNALDYEEAWQLMDTMLV